MSYPRWPGCALFLGALICTCAYSHVEAGARSIRAGDEIVVTIGPAPVKQGDQTLTTVEAGRKLLAEEVKGDMVKVTVMADAGKVTGWIPALHLRSSVSKHEAEAAGHEKKAEAMEPPKSTEPLKAEESEALDLALKETMKNAGAFPGADCRTRCLDAQI